MRRRIVSTRGPNVGVCNICGSRGQLTEDHTPPKGCYKPRQIELQHLTARLAVERHGWKSTFSQDGVKYRTLCGRCNNTLLGTRYDPHLIRFVNHVSAFLRSGLQFPLVTHIEGNPQAIMKSIVGHLCAQGVGRYRKGPNTEIVRDYILDEARPLPETARVFYWAYPFRSHVMARDAVYIDLSRHDSTPFAVWFLKFFPVAFLVAWDGPNVLPYATQSMDRWRLTSLADEVRIPLRISGITPEYWPEAPSPVSTLAFSSAAVSAVPRRSFRSP